METKYYAMIDGEQRGPFTLEELPGAGVRPSTYIWTKGMDGWQRADENADVCRLFRNHLYDKMHGDKGVGVGGEGLGVGGEGLGVGGEGLGVGDKGTPPATRFDRLLQQAGEDPLPTLEEIEEKIDKNKPPISMIGYAWLVTIFCFLPTGIVALVNAYKTKGAWKRGDNKMAHEYSRRAKMWTGISLFIGVIFYGGFIALSL